MSDLGDFANRIRKIAANVKDGGPKAVRQVATVALQAVVMATPVGNTSLWNEHSRSTARPGYVGGRARANWQVGLNSPVSGSVDDVDAAGGGTISAGIAIIAGATQDGQEIHITNNLPYIVPLNEGHSHQAPAGFVELAVQRAVTAVKDFRITE
jgi:hypothetical protein